MNKQLTSVQESLEPIQKQLEEHEDQLQFQSSDNKKNFEEVAKEMQRQMSDLVIVRDEAAVIKTIGLASDQRVKVIQSTMADLLQTTEVFGNRFVEISMRIEREKMEVLKSVADTEDALKISMYEKHAEIEGAVQNMKENLDLMSHPSDSHNKHGLKSPMNRHHGRGGHHGKNFGGAHGAVGGGQAGGGIVAAALDAGGTPAASVEDQLDFAKSHAHFVSDLCINFEEVAIRRSDVPTIPNVIIENVIATVQVLTAYIASCSDAESVVTVLRQDPNEVAYEDIVQMNRNEKMGVFLREINFLLHEKPKKLLVVP